ncbi:MAG TPA: hypothetical protein PL110_02015 [Candidatus Eremiobacteraeota bacterium]|nr:hypothetical protein [Candidatus Eremiobacteraeota bacterium]
MDMNLSLPINQGPIQSAKNLKGGTPKEKSSKLKDSFAELEQFADAFTGLATQIEKHSKDAQFLQMSETQQITQVMQELPESEINKMEQVTGMNLHELMNKPTQEGVAKFLEAFYGIMLGGLMGAVTDAISEFMQPTTITNGNVTTTITYKDAPVKLGDFNMDMSSGIRQAVADSDISVNTQGDIPVELGGFNMDMSSGIRQAVADSANSNNLRPSNMDLSLEMNR